MPPTASRAGRTIRLRTASRAILAAAVGAAALTLTLAGCDRLRARAGIELRGDDPRLFAEGKAIYGARCAACHGARLEGQPNWRERDGAGRLPAPPHDPSGHTWHHPDQVLFDLVKYGVARAAHLKDYASAMPAFEGTLSDAEIIAVLTWIKAQWPSDIRKQQEQIDDAARRRRQD
jgi:S-disulfanyl-L-cysteine oxidoreductase SoxD